MNPKAIRMAIGISTGIFLVAGSLALFYSANQILPYSQSLQSNIRVANKNGVFETIEDYRLASNTPLLVEKRASLQKFFLVAISHDLIGKTTLSDRELETFLKDIDSPAPRTTSLSSVLAQETMAQKLQSLVKIILEKSDELHYDKPQEFDQKKRVFSMMAKISGSMDSSGSFAANQARVTTSSMILQKIHQFQIKTAASTNYKEDLIASCVPTLKQPYDIALMFRFEHLRMQNMIDVSHGALRADPKSEVFLQPKPFSFLQRLKLAIPGVQAAWESRFHEVYSLAISECLPDPFRPPQSDAMILADTDTNLYRNHFNTEYINHFGVNIANMVAAFNHKDWFLWHIRDEQKKAASQSSDRIDNLPKLSQVHLNNP
jgi:hypothetical protein